MKIYDPKRLKNIIILIVGGACMIPAMLWAIDTVAEGFRATTTHKRIDAHSQCYYVYSKTASDYFVPTKTADEWTAFRANHSASEMGKYSCTVPDTLCRVRYQFTLDSAAGGVSTAQYTPYTNNTNTYVTGAYSTRINGQDNHCDSPGCGLRASVECAAGAGYAIRVSYQYDLKNTLSPVRYTPWSNASTGYGSWAQVATGDDQECNQGCGIRMTIEDDNPEVTCSISYRHRDETTETAYASDGSWAVRTHGDSGDNEDCEGAGCGLQVRIYCDGPGASNGGSSSSSTSSTSSSTSSGGSSGCFIAGTQVTLSSGDTKNIEDIKLGDKLLARGDQINTVMKRYIIDYKGEIYRFNDTGDYFFTDTHPFLTKEGWKSMNPAGTRLEISNFEVSQLTVGDTVILDDGELYISSLDSEYQERKVYNFTVDGTNEYIADGYIVHNKLIQ